MNNERNTEVTPEDSKIGPEHYIQAWNGAAGLTISWLAVLSVLSIGSYFLIYSWIVRPEKETIAMVIGSIGFSYGLYVFASLSLALFRNSIEVKLEGDEILGWGVYRQHKRLRFDDIASIKPVGGPGRTLELRSLSNPKFRMRLDPAIICFGELMEKILARAENLRELNLKKLPEKADCWYKLPDLAVIHAAEERARQNQTLRG